MPRRELAAREPRLKGLRILVVGLGRSGIASTRLLASKGAGVLAADQREESDLGDAAAEVRSLGAQLHAGGHPPELLQDVDLVVTSPGVPASSPILVEARRQGKPVWGEVELAYRFCRGRLIGITGSNGKSTTTSMVGNILREAGVRGGAGGNLGTPFSDLLRLDGPDAVHAIELSSFQLETIVAFRAGVAVVLNLSPDHLDRHTSYEDYVSAKARLLTTQEASDAAVLNADDPECARLRASVRGRAYLFSISREVDAGALVREGVLWLKDGTGEASLLRAEELPVPGEHNVGNALAAALACRLVGCETDAIARGLRSFRALPHRLQYVATLDGIKFFNDSKATNLDAAARALRSFPPGSVHLILGGRDKGADWSSLASLVLRYARRVLLVGEAASVARKGLLGTVPLVDCGTVRSAVRTGFEGASPGEVVLLAPGCASFDQYRNFEERGHDFCRAVEALLPAEDHHA